MRWPILLAGAACLMPAAAHAQKEMNETVGNWSLSGTDGDCMIATTTPQGIIAIASPATGGENNGGVILSREGLTVPPGRSVAALTFTGAGGFSGDHPGTGYPDISAYWVGFPDTRTPDGFSDSWRVTAVRDGKTEIDMTVTGFKAARAALWRCVAETK